MDDTVDWFWEGTIQQHVADHFTQQGWRVLSAADTATRQTGIDLVLERDGQRLNVEVKGWPSTMYARGPRAGQPKPTQPTVQARHWFAGALLSAVMLRDIAPGQRVAIAFPDMPRYRDLLARTANSLAMLGVEPMLVDDAGNVEMVDPAALPVDKRRGAVSLRARLPRDDRSGHTGKYRPLWEWLRARSTAYEEMSFAQVEDILGFPLPPSAYNHAAHWSGYEGSAVARAIADAGWRARPNLSRQRVVFERR